MLDNLGALGTIVLVDIVLSGDNALVIGAAAAGLPRRQRLLAIVTGGGGAILLRITFAIAATLLLRLPLLQAIGGTLLVLIAFRLLAGRAEMEHAHHSVEAAVSGVDPTRKLLPAMFTILLADVTMSLDNILAVGAIAAGEIILLMIGLVLSIGLLLVGSAIVAELISRLPWLLDVAALVLGWTAAGMLLEDKQVGSLLKTYPGAEVLVHAGILALILLVDLGLRLRALRRATRLASGAKKERTPAGRA